MAQKNFKLRARVSSDNPSAVEPALKQIITDKGTIRQTDQGFEAEAELKRESAQDLNRTILSELRRMERRTKIRAEWTSSDIVERFFDTCRKEPAGSPVIDSGGLIRRLQSRTLYIIFCRRECRLRRAQTGVS